jgi:N6-L-threonylcarbamoyladenine synthase
MCVRVLGVETSCDETAAAVVDDGCCILSNVISSQVDIHARYGGIVPEVASRQHLLSIAPIVRQAMEQAGVGWQSLTAVAVTVGPGLVGSLLVGANFAKAVAMAQDLPLVGINHLEAHIYANWLEEPQQPGGRTESETLRQGSISTADFAPAPGFPALCLIVSGGHTDLLLMKGHGEYVLLGKTRDDAAGEAFDKAARILELGYPGGPAIQEAAKRGMPVPSLPRAWLKGTHDFSFSGLKTALAQMVQRERGSAEFSPPNLAASFQEAVVDVLVTKTVEAALQHGAVRILLAGGVAANGLLRARLREKSPVPVSCPRPLLCTDNAAMVAACGYYRFQSGSRGGLDLDVSASLSLT